jgi:hypothetical protein
MSSEADKAEIEIKVFMEFVNQIGLPVEADSIKKQGNESEPDTLCIDNNEHIFFELVEICAADLAENLTKLHRGGGELVISTSNPTYEIISSKLNKKYKTELPIELLCYTNGRVVPTDEQILEEARNVSNSVEGSFRKIWLLGENLDVYEVWSRKKNSL